MNRQRSVAEQHLNLQEIAKLTICLRRLSKNFQKNVKFITSNNFSYRLIKWPNNSDAATMQLEERCLCLPWWYLFVA